MKKKILAWLLCAVMVAVMLPAPMASAADFYEDVESFVLTDEGDSTLIESLVAAGCDNLYEALVYVRNNMDAGAPAELTGRLDNLITELDSLGGSGEVFTGSLTDFTGGNSPVGINADGTFIRADFSVYDYHGHAGFSAYDGNVKYTYPLDYAQNGIDMGSYIIDMGGGLTKDVNYKAFGIAWEEAEPTTFVLSNEEGGLIDQLIAAGYGTSNLYEALIALEPASGGVISDDFLDTLAGNPAGSDIFTEPLTTFANAENNPIAINTDGTAHVITLFGRDYYGQTGYSTYPASSTARESFTYADSPAYYIDAGSGSSGGPYYVFAFAWSSNQVPTFMLSNEEDGLIDKLIAAGHEDDSLYEVLQLLQPISGGTIPADFMSALAARPADCDAKTAPLSDFADESNNPIGIGSDGNLIVAPIYGSVLDGDDDFSTTTGNIALVGDVQFTTADSEDDVIDAGSNTDLGTTHYYKAFGIGWMATESSALTVAGTATDDTAILQIDNKTPSARDKTWDINVTTGTVKAGVSASDVTLTGLPTGLNFSAAKGTGNNIVITLTGAATTALTADATITAVIKGSAVTDEGAADSAGISLKLWYVGEATTLVLTNELGTTALEGGLIDNLIDAGHGDKNLYEVLELLQPDFSSVITERFMMTLDSTPADGEIFTAALNNFGELNNPICVNADGTLGIQPIFGSDYYGDTGYTTTGSNVDDLGTVWATIADDSAHLIDAGEKVESRYYAFAILWMPELTVTGTATDDTAILQIDNKTPSARDKTWDISVTTGTVKAGVSASDVTLTGLPAGLTYTAAKGTGNNIVITLTGAATTALTADATITAVIKGSAVTDEGAADSAGISLKLWYVGEGTTIVLTNEAGGLIDKLIDAGHGTKNLYQVMQLLQPYSNGTITNRFIQTLASTPAVSNIFTAELSNFSVNYPACVNADGTITIQPIYANDYDGEEGYTTASSTYTGVGVVRLTTADSTDDYIDAGFSTGGDHYKAFAIAWMSTGGGDPSPVAPTVVTNDASGITASGATLNGNVTSDGGATVTARGFAYGTSANPTTAGSTAPAGDGTGTFTAAISGLTAGATYHVRAYAINSEGTSYGTDREFTTLTGGGGGDPSPVKPTVATNAASGVTTSGATLNGNVTASGGATVTARGFVYGLSADPAIGGAGVTQAASGGGTGTFTAAISGLSASTTYHVRAYATNSAGTAYGSDVTFTTSSGGGSDPDDPYIFRTLTDSATGIIVSGYIHRDAALTVKNTVLHAAGTCAACDAIRARMTDSDFITLADKDISLSLGFTGSLTVTIPVGAQYNGETVTILHCANGTLKTYTATVQDGKATFTVTSLSPFAVFADADELDNIPKTGDGGGFPLWLGLMSLGTLGGCLWLLLRRRPKRA